MKERNMAEKFRVGIVGCGFFAQNHLNAWAGLKEEGVEIAAVCDLNINQAQVAAKSFSVGAVYSDMATMIAEENLDLVDIVTQVQSHLQLVTVALDARIPTVVQKPFGPSLPACRAMLEHANRNNTFLAVHENFRFQHPHRTISKMLAAGRIGTATWSRISFRTGYDIYAGQPYLRDEKRFILTDIGVHVLDLARVFLGEVKHLSAELQSRDPNVLGEDTATLMLRHVSGAVSLVECTYASKALPDPFPVTRIEIEGSDGALRLDGDLSISLTSQGKVEFVNGDVQLLDWAERPWHVVQDSVQATCLHVLNSIRAGKPADIQASDNIRTYALVDAAYESAASGQVVYPID
jgi:predicted dehydrogenase